jgi:Cupin superfamily protein
MRLLSRLSSQPPLFALRTNDAWIWWGMAVSRLVLLLLVVVPLVEAWVAPSSATEIPRFASVAEYQAAAAAWNIEAHHHHHCCHHRTVDSNDAPPQLIRCWNEIPVIIEGVLSVDEREAVCHEIMSLNGIVTVQRRRVQQAKTTMSQVSLPLDRAVNAMLQSQHNDARWCFAEGLVQRHSPDLSQRLRLVRERVWSFLSKNETINDDLDWFSFFPVWAKPAEDCLIMSGVGSTSTLHRDPFEWTGTSLGLEGTKVWRFINPNSSVHDVDALMQSYRLPSRAWHAEHDDTDESIVLSAGWQSDYSLYRTSTIPLPTLDSMESSLPLSRHDQDQLAVSLQSGLVPDMEIVSAVTQRQSSSPAATPSLAVWATVQRAGDLVVIPAHWWHQTYALLEPCVSISSQRCASHEARRVLRHILDAVDDTYPQRGVDRRPRRQKGTTGIADAVDKANAVVDQEKTAHAILDSVCHDAEPRASVERFFAWLEHELNERQCESKATLL